MQLYPAIDMKDGKCVRLAQGEFQEVRIYSEYPEKVAEYWQEQGATFLHLVDLDGAVAGHSVNEDVIRRIVHTVQIPIQLGGGIRSRESVYHMLKLGIDRVIIGTKAVETPELIRDLILEFGPEKIVVGVDAKDGMVAIEGWKRISEISAADLCMQMKAYGTEHVIYTDISCDGMLSGPNISETKKLTLVSDMDIIASGGVSSMEDLKKLHQEGIKGVIIGKALYENRIHLKTAVTLFE